MTPGRRHVGSLVGAVMCLSVLGCLSFGCDGGENNVGGGSGGVSGANSGGGAAGTAKGACKEVPLFAPLVLGDPYGDGGSDLIRQIRIDDSTGEMFFIGYMELFRLAPGSSTPVKVLDSSGMTDFWLQTDQFLFPDSVLSSAPRVGGAETLLVSPAAATKDRPAGTSLWQVVEGKHVYWVDSRGNPLAANPPPDLYTIYKNAWTAPDPEPTLLYQGNLTLEELVIAGSEVYFLEETAEDSNSYRQMRVSTSGGAATDMKSTLNGDVLAGNAQELVVSRTDYQSGSWGLFVMAPDGTNQVKLDDSMLINEVAERQGVWGFVDFPGAGDSFTLFTYTAAAGRRDIGCVDAADTTIHAAALTADAMVVAIYRNDKTTILRYPL